MPTLPPTAGPWTVQRRSRRGAAVGWRVLARNAVLAELTGDGDRAASEIAANARLMASAPRLAASLRVLSLLLRRHFAAAAPSGPRPDRRLMLAACAAADAVLAESGDTATQAGSAAASR